LMRIGGIVFHEYISVLGGFRRQSFEAIRFNVFESHSDC
jgi:hypothetical protein